jgi:hypothetical protein
VTRRRYFMIAAVLVAILALGLVARVVTAPPTGPSHGLPAGNTILDFEATVARQLAAPELAGFAVKGIYSVRCVTPDVWRAGKTFTCFIDDRRRAPLGVFTGVVQPGPDRATTSWRATHGGSDGTRNTSWPVAPSAE